MKRQEGFLLCEVLIAITLIAITLSAQQALMQSLLTRMNATHNSYQQLLQERRASSHTHLQHCQERIGAVFNQLECPHGLFFLQYPHAP